MTAPERILRIFIGGPRAHLLARELDDWQRFWFGLVPRAIAGAIGRWLIRFEDRPCR